MPVKGKQVAQFGIAAGTRPAAQILGLEDAVVGFTDSTFEGGQAGAQRLTGYAMVAAAIGAVALAYYGDITMSQKMWALTGGAAAAGWGGGLIIDGMEG
jgi:hypothetical protein